MERLSSSPYNVRRLDPPIGVPVFSEPEAEAISGNCFDQLFQDGRLFYVDYRAQYGLPRTNQTGAACDALFYINDGGDFMPLAIRTNVGSNLVYTPLDDANDWLLAKLMFNVNDFWETAWKHLAATHQVGDRSGRPRSEPYDLLTDLLVLRSRKSSSWLHIAP